MLLSLKPMKLLLQKSEGDFPLIGASVGLADCINSILWRGDLPAALCAIAVRMLKMDLRMPHSEVRTHSSLLLVTSVTGLHTKSDRSLFGLGTSA